MTLAALLPTRCGACGSPGASPCRACWETFRRAGPLRAPPPLSALHAALVYEGQARELVARLKYRNERASLRWLAEAMAAEVGPGTAATAAVTWAPTTDARRRARGFDHAETLARHLAGVLGRPVETLLRRLPGPPQTGLSPAARVSNPMHFEPARSPETVLLVDDIVTTGATLAAAARALRSAGASTVIGVTAATTPLKRPLD